MLDRVSLCMLVISCTFIFTLTDIVVRCVVSMTVVMVVVVAMAVAMAGHLVTPVALVTTRQAVKLVMPITLLVVVAGGMMSFMLCIGMTRQAPD